MIRWEEGTTWGYGPGVLGLPNLALGRDGSKPYIMTGPWIRFPRSCPYSRPHDLVPPDHGRP